MNFQRPSSRLGGIEMAPLVDVIFLLLLFFVLSYNAAGESAIQVLLPPSAEADQAVGDEVVITIEADGDVFLDGAPLTLPELSDALRRVRRRQAEDLVTIRADRRLAVDMLIKVVDATKQAGFLSFSIVTRMLP